MMQYVHTYNSAIGNIVMASDGEGLVGLWFEGQKYFGSTLSDIYKEEKLPVFDQACRWLDCYFSGKQPDFMPLLHLNGTFFQQMVWRILLTVPYGHTVTYKEIAEKVANTTGKRMSPQAVGGAVGHNPISILIPCHRVVGANGSLTGYAGGISKKIALLTLEQVDMAHFFVPSGLAI